MGKMADLCKLEGVDEVFKNFDKYTISAQETINSAIKNGTRDIAKSARAKAPYDSSRSKGTHLRKGIKTSVKKANKRYAYAQGIVKTLYAVTPHAHLVEFGTKPHTIRGKVLMIMANGIGRFVRAPVQHPGAQAKPFLTPAFNENKNKIISAIKGGIK